VLLKIIMLMAFSSSALTTKFYKPIDFEKTNEPKALVFISSECPCSKAHIEHIKKVASENKILNLFAVATSPMNKTKEVSYYKQVGLKVIYDKKNHLLKKYKALKTPHLSIINNNKIIYQGGVTNKTSPLKATKFFFKEVASAISKNESTPYKQGVSLGCYIKRAL